jgi:hypothetical protein
MPVQRLGRDSKFFQETMGRGGSTFFIIRPEKKDSQTPAPESNSPSHMVPDTPEGMEQAVKQIFQEAKEQMSADSPSEKTEE